MAPKIQKNYKNNENDNIKMMTTILTTIIIIYRNIITTNITVITNRRDLRLTSLSCCGSRGILFMMSLSACSYASEMAGTRSVPRSIHRMVIVPSGSGTSARMNTRNGEISGMLLVRVYAIDFLRLSKIRRPANGTVQQRDTAQLLYCLAHLHPEPMQK